MMSRLTRTVGIKSLIKVRRGCLRHTSPTLKSYFTLSLPSKTELVSSFVQIHLIERTHMPLPLLEARWYVKVFY